MMGFDRIGLVVATNQIQLIFESGDVGGAISAGRELQLKFHNARYSTLPGCSGIFVWNTCCRAGDAWQGARIAGGGTATRGACAWLGVPWAQSMRDVAANAQRLATNKVSTMQVRRGLYEEGAGHWRRYRDELDPILPVLQPWIARFRYPES